MKRLFFIILFLPVIAKAQFIDNNPRIFNILKYGAKPDGRVVYNGSMTSGSANFTATGAGFTTADIGKAIRVEYVAASNFALVTTIQSVTNSNTVVLAASATNTVSFDTCYFGTDNTVAIQNCVNAAYAAGGGTVLVPQGWFMIAGALVTSFSGANPNCQITIPLADLTGSGTFNSRTHVVISGEVPPNFLPGSWSVDSVVSKKLSIIHTLISGSGNAPAIFGTKANDGGNRYINYNMATYRNLTLLVPKDHQNHGPTIGGINGFYLASTMVDNCMVVTDGATSTEPNFVPAPEVAGIITNQIASETMSRVDQTLVQGFKYGIVFSDHATGVNPQAFACQYGLVFTNCFEAMGFSKATVQWCNYAIYVPGSTILGYILAGPAYFSIGNLNVEAFPTSYWWNYTKMVYDPSSLGRGIINYTIVNTGSGAFNIQPVKTGGDSIFCYQIGSAVDSNFHNWRFGTYQFQHDGNGANSIFAQNNTAGSAANTYFAAKNDLGNYVRLQAYSSTTTANAGWLSGAVGLYSNAPRLNIMAENLDGRINIMPGFGAQINTSFTQTKTKMNPAMLQTGSGTDSVFVYHAADSSLYLVTQASLAGAGSTPGGANTNIQFNNSGAFGGDAGFTYTTGTGITELVKGQNAATRYKVTNTTAGASSQAGMLMTSDGGNIFNFFQYSSTTTAYGAIAASDGGIYRNGNMTLMADLNTGVIKFAAGSGTGPAEGMRLNSSNHLTIGTTTDNGALTVAGVIAPEASATRNLGTSSFKWNSLYLTDLVGTTTNNNAASGAVGQYVSSLIAIGSEVTIPTASATNITSISLTAGDWDVQGQVNFDETGATVSARTAGISSTSATIPSDGSEGYLGATTVTAGQFNTITIPRIRFSLSGTTTVYLIGSATFSAGTVKGYGNITARRVR